MKIAKRTEPETVETIYSNEPTPVEAEPAPVEASDTVEAEI